MVINNRRAILLYNFGLAATLIVCGLLTFYAMAILGHDGVAVEAHSGMRARAAAELSQDQDLEHLRSTAAFYFQVSQELKKARDEETQSFFAEIRYGCFLLAATFFLGGLLGFGVKAVADAAGGDTEEHLRE